MICPNCNRRISIIFYRIWPRLKCPHCAAKLTVKNLSTALLAGTIIFGGVEFALVYAEVHIFVEMAVLFPSLFFIYFILSKYYLQLCHFY